MVTLRQSTSLGELEETNRVGLGGISMVPDWYGQPSRSLCFVRDLPGSLGVREPRPLGQGRPFSIVYNDSALSRASSYQ